MLFPGATGRFTAGPLKVVGHGTFDSTDELPSQVSRVQKLRPDTLLFLGDPDEYRSLLQLVRTRGLTSKVLYANSWMPSSWPDYVGTYVVTLFASWTT